MPVPLDAAKTLYSRACCCGIGQEGVPVALEVIAEAPEPDAHLWLLRNDGSQYRDLNESVPGIGQDEGAAPPQSADPASNISVLSERERVLGLLQRCLM